MKKSTATFLLVAFGLLATCFGGGYYLLRQYAGPMMEQTKLEMDEAKAFALTTDNSGCVAETKVRYEKEGDMTGGMKEMMFLSACLRFSKPTAGFCDGVPSSRDLAKSQPWQREKCGAKAATPGNMRCPLAMAAVQNFCHDDKAAG